MATRLSRRSFDHAACRDFKDVGARGYANLKMETLGAAVKGLVGAIYKGALGQSSAM